MVLLLIPIIVEWDFVNFFISETQKNISEFQNISVSKYIRGIMIYNGFLLFLIYFPIGSGAATFGSVMSEGSIVYYELGIAGLEFFEDFWGVFDSNLAAILGEFGLIGVFVFGFLYFCCFKRVYSASKNKKVALPYLIIIFIFGLVVLITNPFFMYQYNSLIFLLAIFIVDCIKVKV